MHEFPLPQTWLAHRVSYGETDCMGVMYYAEYLCLFERGRSEYIRERGISYAEVEKRGVIIPVREAQCRYRSPCHYDELIFIRTGISEIGRASFRFIYETFDENKTRLLAEGMTQHALVNREGKPVRLPDWFRTLLTAP